MSVTMPAFNSIAAATTTPSTRVRTRCLAMSARAPVSSNMLTPHPPGLLEAGTVSRCGPHQCSDAATGRVPIRHPGVRIGQWPGLTLRIVARVSGPGSGAQAGAVNATRLVMAIGPPSGTSAIPSATPADAFWPWVITLSTASY